MDERHQKHYAALQELHAFCLLTPNEQAQLEKIKVHLFCVPAPFAHEEMQVMYRFMTRVLDAAKRADDLIPTPEQCRHCKAEAEL